jgi:hypothetical protein
LGLTYRKQDYDLVYNGTYFKPFSNFSTTFFKDPKKKESIEIQFAITSIQRYKKITFGGLEMRDGRGSKPRSWFSNG